MAIKHAISRKMYWRMSLLVPVFLPPSLCCIILEGNECYTDTADKNRQQLRTLSGHQAGDPERAAAAIVHAVESHNPPHRLLLGNDAYDGAMAKLDELREEFEAWEDVSRAADFPKAKSTVDSPSGRDRARA